MSTFSFVFPDHSDLITTSRLPSCLFAKLVCLKGPIGGLRNSTSMQMRPWETGLLFGVPGANIGSALKQRLQTPDVLSCVGWIDRKRRARRISPPANQYTWKRERRRAGYDETAASNCRLNICRLQSIDFTEEILYRKF